MKSRLLKSLASAGGACLPVFAVAWCFGVDFSVRGLELGASALVAAVFSGLIFLLVFDDLRPKTEDDE